MHDIESGQISLDVRDLSLEALQGVEDGLLRRVLEWFAKDSGEPVAGFQSSI
ncbi:FxSxx-COOH cyclophane-containing RiPP peptide [Streptosporangium sp. NPDC051023]|uniref:FxSxx-COOH cyclophane-containing RiPP peptide n=1 Tax=Streptosporangium sp. NPDC051023 TaxID=3155410 RepID=UPI00344CAD63